MGKNLEAPNEYVVDTNQRIVGNQPAHSKCEDRKPAEI